MNSAFERLTEIQRDNINKPMFIIAYNCILQSRGDSDLLTKLIIEKTKECPHLTSDLIRYCRLVEKVK